MRPHRRFAAIGGPWRQLPSNCGRCNMSKLSEAAAILGREGGRATSEAKRKAVAQNAKLGGRPRTRWLLTLPSETRPMPAHQRFFKSEAQAREFAAELRRRLRDVYGRADWQRISITLRGPGLPKEGIKL